MEVFPESMARIMMEIWKAGRLSLRYLGRMRGRFLCRIDVFPREFQGSRHHYLRFHGICRDVLRLVG